VKLNFVENFIYPGCLIFPVIYKTVLYLLLL